MPRAGLDTRPVADFAPDTLYAVMVFWLLGATWTRATPAQIAFAAPLFCYAIEASQLIQSPILSAVRATRLGDLVLGFGFLWSDIICYMAGVAAGFAAEIGTRNASGRKR